MKTLIVIVVTAAITWIAFSVSHGVQTGIERLWLMSAVKAPGRMALEDIQTDMDAGRYELAKAKIDAFMDTWKRFNSDPHSFSGPGIGDIMVTFSKLDKNRNMTLPRQEGGTNGSH